MVLITAIVAMFAWQFEVTARAISGALPAISDEML